MGESDQWEGRGGPKSTAAGMPRAGRIHQESTACSWNSDGGWVERGGEVVEKYMGWDGVGSMVCLFDFLLGLWC